MEIRRSGGIKISSECTDKNKRMEFIKKNSKVILATIGAVFIVLFVVKSIMYRDPTLNDIGFSLISLYLIWAYFKSKP